MIRLYPGVATDAELVAALRARLPHAAAGVVNRYGAYVERLLTRVVGDHREMPDLLRSTFVRAIEDIHALDDVTTLKNWLGGLALRTARHFVRRRLFSRAWQRLVTPKKWSGRSGICGSEHDLSPVLTCTYAVLDRLPVEERIAFSLRMLDGMALAELADLCGTSLGTINRRIARAQRRFTRLALREPLLSGRIVRRGSGTAR